MFAAKRHPCTAIPASTLHPIASLRRWWLAGTVAAMAFVGGSAGASDKQIEAAIDALAQPMFVDPPIQAPQQLTALSPQHLACSAEPGATFTTTNAVATEVVNCSINAPAAGVIIASGSGSMLLEDTAYEARATLSIDSTAFDNTSVRYVDVYTDANDGSDKSIALSTYANVTAGPHTIRFLAGRQSGTGTVRIFPTLTALFVPSPQAATTTCGAKPGSVTTIAASSVSVASCSVTVTEPGIAFVVGTASIGYAGSTPSHAVIRIQHDGTPFSTRRVRARPDSGDGSDESVMTQLSTTVSAGTQTFAMTANVNSGTGSFIVRSPVISVIVVPTSAAAICSSPPVTGYENATSTYTSVAGCSVTVPQNAQIMAFASASLGAYSDNDTHEAILDLSLNNLTGLGITIRWVDLYLGTASGDLSVAALNTLRPIAAGTPQTLSLIARRFRGPGRVQITNADLSFLVLSSDPIFASGFDSASN